MVNHIMKKPFEIFAKEAERWYKIVSLFRLPAAPVKKATKKRLHLTFNNKYKSIALKLRYIYGEEKGKETFEKIQRKMLDFSKKKPTKLKYRDAYYQPLDRFTQKDAVLITYPDSFQATDSPPLQVLRRFAVKRLINTFNTIHILPFYPSSSDRGFSVMNYKKVDSAFGTWDDISSLSKDFKIMLDAVINHVSSKGLWFKKFLQHNPLYENHFITFNRKDAIAPEQMKKIVRPRTSPLLSKFTAKKKTIYVWTTFSSDQVDLNYKEPRTLLRIIDVLFKYITNGATIIRLDAVNYIWKEIGTSCINLKQTHVMVQLFRDILDLVAPSVSIITETNVSHPQNIKYFGNGSNEAQAVYNFALPPLVLYTFYRKNAKNISRWADRLDGISKYCTYFNFLSSHDGVGLMPAKRILPQREVSFLVKQAKLHGSLIQYKTLGSGKKAPYELNITWWNAINSDKSDEKEELMINRYLASWAIALSLKGICGVYYNCLFGTRNDTEAIKKSKTNRDINRKNFFVAELYKDIKNNTLTRKVFDGMTSLLKTRSSSKAFHPSAEQRIIMQNDAIFSLIRTSIDSMESVLVLVNVSDKEQDFTVNCRDIRLNNRSLYNLISKKKVLCQPKNISVNEFTLSLKPYEIAWIRSIKPGH